MHSAELTTAKIQADTIPTSLSETRFEIVTARTVNEVQSHLPAWEDLCRSLLDENPFYEPAFLLPVLEYLCENERPILVFLYVEDPAFRHGRRTLAGFFPVMVSSNYHGAPVRTLQLWQYTYCPLCLPLVRKELAEETLREFLRWTQTKPFGARIFAFQRTAADGPFASLFSELLIASRRSTFIFDFYPRALFSKNAASFDDYMSRALSGKHRKDLRRIEKRLSEMGALEYVELTSASELPRWTTEFIQLEASSWKGRNGTAFAMEVNDTAFFQESLARVFREGRLMMLALKLNGKFIAMKYNILAAPGSFSFKIAFDESYSRFSAGVLLELENMRRLFTMPEIAWMDSCAVSNHPMINRLWTERRMIQAFLISDGSHWGDFWIAALPLTRWVRGFFRSFTQKFQKEAAQ